MVEWEALSSARVLLLIILVLVSVVVFLTVSPPSSTVARYPPLPRALPKEMHWRIAPVRAGASDMLQKAVALERELFTEFLNLSHDCDLGIFGHPNQPSLDDRVRRDGQWKLCKPLSPEGKALGNFRPPCVVVSGGISGDWTFEYALSDLGCHVHGYDPTIDTAKIPMKHPDLFHAYRIGFGDVDGMVGGHHVKSLDTIMKDHGISTVDVLKMDVEGAEYPTFDGCFRLGTLARVKQISFEVHFDGFTQPLGLHESHAAQALKTYPRYLSYFHRLRQNGFVPVDWHQNSACAWCKELLWVNVKYSDELGLRPKTTLPPLDLKK